MEGVRRRTAGGTLAARWGFPRSRRRRPSATIDRAVSAIAAAVAMGAALMGTAISLGGSVEPGVVADDPGGEVREVMPGGFAWNDGIRPGQRVVSLGASDDPGGWSLEVEDQGVRVRTSAAGAEQALRASWPIALLAVAMAAAAILSIGRPSRAAALSVLGIGLAAIPVRIHADPLVGVAVPLIAAAAPTLWLLRWGPAPVRIRVGMAAVMILVLLVWTAARSGGWPTYGLIDDVRVLVLALATGIVLARAAGFFRRASFLMKPQARAIDAAWLVALLVLCGLVLMLGDIPPVFVAIGLVFAVGIYPALRRLALRGLDRLLLADLRDRASIEASEEERARLARDLHDAPLQELAGVIQRLELVPAARGEGDALRGVAQQLRAVATDLRPPVLDDLGLAAAIKFLGDHAHAAGTAVPVQLAIENDAGIRMAQRPPPEVELALFRIVQEALSNAIRHSGARTVRVQGRVATDHVSLAVVDDGGGIPPGARLAAVQDGRLGLDSMHRRADAVGADIRVRSNAGAGTMVEVEWSR